MSNTKENGISFMSLLQLLFIALKLTGYVEWNWIWVLCPTWIIVAIIIIFIISKVKK